MLANYLPIFILVAIGFTLVFILANLSRLLGPYRPNRIKEMPYESGMDPVGSARERFSVKFYLIAMMFIVFDIEVVFMYPWAVQFKQLGLFAFVEMLIFIFILFVGYVYVYKKGGLKWD